MALRRAARRLRLPNAPSPVSAAGQGFAVPTTVGPSRVCEGRGRLLSPGAPSITAGSTLVAQKTLVSMASVETLAAVPPHCVLECRSRDELERYIARCQEEGGHTREAVLEVLEHFGWGVDDERVLVNVVAWMINHGDAQSTNAVEGTAVLKVEEVPLDVEEMGSTTALQVRSTVDVEAACEAELLVDYRDFRVPAFYREFCEEHGLADITQGSFE